MLQPRGWALLLLVLVISLGDAFEQQGDPRKESDPTGRFFHEPFFRDFSFFLVHGFSWEERRHA